MLDLQRMRYRAIPEPTMDIRSIHNTVMALKEVVETVTLQRNNSNPPVFWGDLVRLGLAKKADFKTPQQLEEPK